MPRRGERHRRARKESAHGHRSFGRRPPRDQRPRAGTTARCGMKLAQNPRHRRASGFRSPSAPSPRHEHRDLRVRPQRGPFADGRCLVEGSRRVPEVAGRGRGCVPPPCARTCYPCSGCRPSRVLRGSARRWRSPSRQPPRPPPGPPGRKRRATSRAGCAPSGAATSPGRPTSSSSPTASCRTSTRSGTRRAPVTAPGRCRARRPSTRGTCARSGTRRRSAARPPSASSRCPASSGSST